MKAYLSIAACILLFLGAVFWTTNLVIPLFMYLAVTGIARELRFWKDTPDRLDYLIGMGIFRRVMAVTFGCIASIVAVWGLWSGIRTGDRWAMLLLTMSVLLGPALYWGMLVYNALLLQAALQSLWTAGHGLPDSVNERRLRRHISAHPGVYNLIAHRAETASWLLERLVERRDLSR